ncbi:MAG: lysine--tRNA ligase [Candidatus Omnitrophica bacterium]|nr:lysine--tRNA ligase [Candidatus Omnitrophota bacterium]
METTNEVLKERLEKIKSLRDKNLDLYGSRFQPVEPVETAVLRFEEGKKVRLAGRLMAVRSHGKSAFADLKDQSARIQIYVKKDLVGEESYDLFQKLDLGDILGVEGALFMSKTGEKSVKIESFRLLSKIVQILPEKWHGLKDVEIRYRRRYLDLIVNEEVRKTFALRSAIVRSIRKFLDARGFMEVETPMMQSMPGGAKAEPFKTHHRVLHMDLYLRVAPELYLKRLLVGGFEKVYEINRNFRNEGISIKHNPEFTMLELYQSYADLSDMLEITEEMFSSLVKELHGKEVISFGAQELNFARPWKRISFYEALKEKTGLEWRGNANIRKDAERLKLKMEPDYDDVDILNELFDEFVEPTLVNPTFVVDYPLVMSPLAKRKAGTEDLTERFELFIANMELANAFSELNDPWDQRERFMKQKEALGADKKIDEDFLLALEYGMPPAGGLGIGIDRLVMLLTNQHSIRDVILFPHLKPESAEKIEE